MNSVSRLGLALALFLAGPVLSQESQRITPAVRVISQIEPAVLPIFTNATQSTGTGAVIHESGFVLTADHVTTNSPGIALFGLHRAEYEIVGRVPERDLAVLKVADLSKLKHAIKIGRSNDLQIGEPIIVGGNPGGRGIVFSQGTINSASIEPSWPNILVKSFWRNETDVLSAKRERSTGGRPDFIQYDATTNKGNSGGPIVNFDGEIVGLAALKGAQEEGINWAIPIDRIRMFMPYLVPSEEVGAFELGLEVDMLGTECRVLAVRKDSAAWNAGLRTGDILKQLNQQSVRTGPEWLIALWGHKAERKLQLHSLAEMKSNRFRCNYSPPLLNRLSPLPTKSLESLTNFMMVNFHLFQTTKRSNPQSRVSSIESI